MLINKSCGKHLRGGTPGKRCVLGKVKKVQSDGVGKAY